VHPGPQAQNYGPQSPPFTRPNYGHPPPPYGAPHETYIVQATPARTEAPTSITRLTVPILLVVSFGGFLVVATHLTTAQFSEIRHAIERLSAKIESLTGELSTRISRVENDTSELAKQGWSRRDHETWCAKAERANQASGWTCGDTEPLRRYPAPAQPQVNGWAIKR
jgi:hypothetical protein